EDVVLENTDLRHHPGALAPAFLSDDHHAVDGLPPREELRLRQDRLAPLPRLASVAPTLPLRRESCGPGDSLDLVRPRAAAGGLVPVGTPAPTTTAPTTPPTGPPVAGRIVAGIAGVIRVGGVRGDVPIPGLLGIIGLRGRLR